MPALLKRIANIWRRLRDLRRLPFRIEFVLTDYCNLNCKGCTHFSPLAPKEFTRFDTLLDSMKHIADICGNKLEKVDLLGGEPLIYPEITAAMKAMRNIFPSQKLYIFTNGIALYKMDNDFWETCISNRIVLAITKYPINFDYNALIDFCHSKGDVELEIFADRAEPGSFFRFALDPQKKQNGALSYFKCYNRNCLSVINDLLFPCSISACVQHLNRALGTEFKHSDGDFLHIPSIKSIKQIQRLRKHRVPFCSYCIAPPQTVKYEASTRDISEWVELNH